MNSKVPSHNLCLNRHQMSELKAAEILNSEKLSPTVTPTLHRLRYSTESGNLTISAFGDLPKE